MRNHTDPTAGESSTAIVADSLLAALELHAAAHPDRAALISGPRTVGYGELNARANQLADQLCHQGVGPEVPVGLCASQGISAIIGMLAIGKADGVCVPIHPRLPIERGRRMASIAGLRLVVTTEADAVVAPAIGGPTANIRIDGGCPRTPDLHSRLRPDNLARILFTSAPNGRPVGVAITHDALESLVRWQAAALPLQPGARVLQFAPLGMDFEAQEILGTLACGGTLVLAGPEARSRPDELFALLREERIERAFLPASTLAKLAEFAGTVAAPLEALREVIAVCGPVHANADLRAFFRRHPAARLHTQHGSIETQVAAAWSFPESPDEWPARTPLGHPVKGAVARILGPGGAPVPDGAPGVLWIGGRGIARGYHRDPAATRQAFAPDPCAAPESRARLFNTGEFVRLAGGGLLETVATRSHHRRPARGVVFPPPLNHKRTPAGADVAP